MTALYCMAFDKYAFAKADKQKSPCKIQELVIFN
jgi:hypothetical protein